MADDATVTIPADPIPTAEWITVPVSDSAEYLDRQPPQYMEDDAAAATAPRRRRRGHAAAAGDTPPAGATTDFAALQAAFEQALEDLKAVWGTVKGVAIAELVGQITGATTAQQLASVMPSAFGGAELAAALVAVTEHGAQSVVEEAAAQGATIQTPALASTHAEISRAAEGVAVLLARSLAISAASKALGVWDGTADTSQVAAQVQEHLEGLTGADAEYELAGLASQAQNAGRFAALDLAGDGTQFYASALNDTNTCAPCREEDGQEFGSMAEARRDFPAGSGYVGCEGGKRCRCTVVVVYQED